MNLQPQTSHKQRLGNTALLIEAVTFVGSITFRLRLNVWFVWIALGLLRSAPTIRGQVGSRYA